MAEIKLLDQKHPTYNADRWAILDALYRGGEAFRAVLPRLLLKNPVEPEDVYRARLDRAAYVPYLGSIVQEFVGRLFAEPLAVRLVGQGEEGSSEPPPWYAEWKEDVDGGGTDLVDFARARFASAAVKGRSWWIVESPGPDEKPLNHAQWEAMGLGRAFLEPLENEQVYDWATDQRGEFEWVIVHDEALDRPSPYETRGIVSETWRIYDREKITVWRANYEQSKRPETAVKVAEYAHGFKRVPIVCMGFVGTRPVRVSLGSARKVVSVSSSGLEGFWLGERLADTAIAHFRAESGMRWSMDRTCYAMPVITLKEDRDFVVGSGYFIRLAEGERYDWTAAPTGHLTFVQEEVDRTKDELYRIANQMAAGVDNNAAALGRSGESKAADAEGTAIAVSVYASVVREALEQTHDLLSQLRGETARWSIEGLGSTDKPDATAAIANAVQAESVPIPSKTFRAEWYIKVARAALPDAEQGTMEQIEREIRAGVKSGIPLAMQPPPEAPVQPGTPNEKLEPAPRVAQRAPLPRGPRKAKPKAQV